MRTMTAAGPVCVGVMCGWLGGMVSKGALRPRAILAGLAATAMLGVEAALLAGLAAGGLVVTGALGGIVAHQCWFAWLRGQG